MNPVPILRMGLTSESARLMRGGLEHAKALIVKEEVRRQLGKRGGKRY